MNVLVVLGLAMVFVGAWLSRNRLLACLLLSIGGCMVGLNWEA